MVRQRQSKRLCGASQPAGFIPLPSSSISSYRGFDPVQSQPPHQYPFNYGDLRPNEVPFDAWAAQPSCDSENYPRLFQNCSVIDDAIYNPALVYPSQILDLDPQWAQCETKWEGLYDPPYLLTMAASAAVPGPNPTPNIPSTPEAATPGSNAGGFPGPTALPEESGSGAGSGSSPEPAPASNSNPGGGIASILASGAGSRSAGQSAATNPGGPIASIIVSGGPAPGAGGGSESSGRSSGGVPAPGSGGGSHSSGRSTGGGLPLGTSPGIAASAGAQTGTAPPHSSGSITIVGTSVGTSASTSASATTSAALPTPASGAEKVKMAADKALTTTLLSIVMFGMGLLII
ncbi:MAG: hypothetical protein Q9157_003879 [Trypethelium eluteriae]